MAFQFFMRRKPDGSLAVKERPALKKTPPLTAEPVSVVHGARPVYAFIDASNLFWGGRESMGFKIDYTRLFNLLKQRFGVTKVFYYGGVRIFDYEYSILDNKPLDLQDLANHLEETKPQVAEEEVLALNRSLDKIHFYQLLEGYGYTMKIKPAKVHFDEDDENHERPILKANCDVDMTFDMMRYICQYSGVVVMTGDGDFASLLQYLKNQGRSVTIISRPDRTAKEIREIAASGFVDFTHLQRQIHY